MDTQLTLSPTTRILHWIIAIGFIVLSAVGIYMANYEGFGLYPWHKSLGIILFVVILLRVLWRWSQGWPVPLHTYQRHEQILAKSIHWILLLGTVAMPITGMMYSGASGHGFGIFGWTLLDSQPDPLNPEEVIPYNESLALFGEAAHEMIGYTLVVAILLHLIGAIKHHVIDKDSTLLRMLGKK